MGRTAHSGYAFATVRKQQSGGVYVEGGTGADAGDMLKAARLSRRAAARLLRSHRLRIPPPVHPSCRHQMRSPNAQFCPCAAADGFLPWRPGQAAASRDDEIRPTEVSSRKEVFHEPLLTERRARSAQLRRHDRPGARGAGTIGIGGVPFHACRGRAAPPLIERAAGSRSGR